jgi:hypothetical protein
MGLVIRLRETEEYGQPARGEGRGTLAMFLEQFRGVILV